MEFAEPSKPHPSGDDYRRQPHRDGRPDQTCLRPEKDRHRRALPTGAHPAHRLQGAGRSRGSRRTDRRRRSGIISGTAQQRPQAVRKQAAELLRRQVDTVGKAGTEGGQIHNVISVQMLSEGWDAKTVTHIMGLRAFTSQLLCEQVVGRGLRRTSYEINPETGLFEPEYVNVFGVPFRFLLHAGGDLGDEPPPPPPEPKTAIEPVPEKAEFGNLLAERSSASSTSTSLG